MQSLDGSAACGLGPSPHLILPFSLQRFSMVSKKGAEGNFPFYSTTALRNSALSSTQCPIPSVDVNTLIDHRSLQYVPDVAFGQIHKYRVPLYQTPGPINYCSSAKLRFSGQNPVGYGIQSSTAKYFCLPRKIHDIWGIRLRKLK